MANFYDVIIAGAGPIGLFLACELGLQGVSVLVLERDLTPDNPWKVAPLGRRGMNTPSVEGFYRRGVLEKLTGPAKRPEFLEKKPGFMFGGHFAGILLNANKLELDRFKYRLPGPALCPGATTIEQVEKVMFERAETLGVTVLRGHGFTKIIKQDNEGVTIEAGENKTFTGRWVVGCDGGRSALRKAAGFDFAGTDAKFTGYAVQCDFDHPEKLKMGFNITKSGMYIINPGSLHLVDFDGAVFDRTQDITQEHLQKVFEQISGVTDVNITKVHLASSFTDRSKQATHYRKGRILLAGDAAHIHSPLGAQGLNLGLGDAMNLGWKLASTVKQESVAETPLTEFPLLDTYEAERHPIAAWVLEWTRAQVSTLQPDLFGGAVQSLIRDLIDTADGTNLFIDRVWGLSQRYNLGDDEAHAHPVIGCSTPDFELADGSRIGPKLEGGKGLLVDFDNSAVLRDLVTDGKYARKVDFIGADAKKKCGLRAVLVRPDGIVAWATDIGDEPNTDTLKAALERWFGA